MGCGYTNTKNDNHRSQLSIYHPDRKGSKKKQISSPYKLLNSHEIELLSKNIISKDATNYFIVSEEAKTSVNLAWKELSFDILTFYDLINAINVNTKLETFKMENIEINGDSDKLVQLSRILMKKDKMKELEFSSISNLGNKKAKSIAKIMEGCNRVERLILKDLEFDDSDARFLSLILSSLSSNLKYFELSLTFFKNNMEEFLKGLYQNNSIRELILNKVNLDIKAFIYLVEAISTNYCLTLLDVSNNPVSSGTIIFKQHLLVNLQKLIMNNCSIDDPSFTYLMEGLKASKKINYIELNNNNISEVSAPSAAEFFKENNVLKQMYLLNNSICKRDLRDKLDEYNLAKIIAEF